MLEKEQKLPLGTKPNLSMLAGFVCLGTWGTSATRTSFLGGLEMDSEGFGMWENHCLERLGCVLGNAGTGRANPSADCQSKTHFLCLLEISWVTSSVSRVEILAHLP